MLNQKLKIIEELKNTASCKDLWPPYTVRILKFTVGDIWSYGDKIEKFVLVSQLSFSDIFL